MLKEETNKTEQELSLENGLVVEKVYNIPEISVRQVQEKPEEDLTELLQVINEDTQVEKSNKKRKIIKRDEHGKKLLTPNQQFILQLNGWVGQLQQALFMMSQIKDSGKQTLIEECQRRIEKFQTLVNIKLEEAKLIGFPLEFYEGSGRYRGLDKNFEMPEFHFIISEEMIKERISLHFSERLVVIEKTLTVARQELNTLSMQGKYHTTKFQEHLSAVTKLEIEEAILREVKIDVLNIIHSLFSTEE